MKTMFGLGAVPRNLVLSRVQPFAACLSFASSNDPFGAKSTLGELNQILRLMETNV